MNKFLLSLLVSGVFLSGVESAFAARTVRRKNEEDSFKNNRIVKHVPHAHDKEDQKKESRLVKSVGKMLEKDVRPKETPHTIPGGIMAFGDDEMTYGYIEEMIERANEELKAAKKRDEEIDKENLKYEQMITFDDIDMTFDEIEETIEGANAELKAIKQRNEEIDQENLKYEQKKRHPIIKADKIIPIIKADKIIPIIKADKIISSDIVDSIERPNAKLKTLKRNKGIENNKNTANLKHILVGSDTTVVGKKSGLTSFVTGIAIPYITRSQTQEIRTKAKINSGRGR